MSNKENKVYLVGCEQNDIRVWSLPDCLIYFYVYAVSLNKCIKGRDPLDIISVNSLMRESNVT